MYPKLCMFSHPLLVWNIVGGFCMSVSFMFNNCFFVRFLWLLVLMCCLFYVEESYIGVLFGCWFGSVPRCRSRLCAFFILGGYACMQKNGLLLCSGFLVSMFSSFTYANDILLTESSLRGGFSIPNFILWYIYSKLLNKPLRWAERTT